MMLEDSEAGWLEGRDSRTTSARQAEAHAATHAGAPRPAAVCTCLCTHCWHNCAQCTCPQRPTGEPSSTCPEHGWMAEEDQR